MSRAKRSPPPGGAPQVLESPKARIVRSSIAPAEVIWRSRLNGPGGLLEPLLAHHALHAGELERPPKVAAEVGSIPGGRLEAAAPARQHEEEEIGTRPMVAGEPVPPHELLVEEVEELVELARGGVADAVAAVALRVDVAEERRLHRVRHEDEPAIEVRALRRC